MRPITIKPKIIKIVWDILEKNPSLKKIFYNFYDRFWLLEKIIGSGDKNLNQCQSDEYLIDINRVRYTFNNFNYSPHNPKKLGKIENLNKIIVKIEDLDEYKSVIAHFVNNIPWKETSIYKSDKGDFSIKYKGYGLSNEEKFLEFLKSLENFYIRLKATSNYNSDYKFKLGIGEKGNYVLVNGIFNYAIVKLLHFPEIPVKIIFRNQKWIDFKNDLLNYLSVHQDIYQPLLHPDLKSIKTSYTEERFKIIKENLHIKSGTLLDIGSNFGFFCHKFEELGFKCNAVEIRPRNVYFMKKLRNIEEKKFKIINKSVFDLEEPLEFDVVLALNIFHHFLKEKVLFEKLIEFLRKLKVKEMFFQPHNSKERIAPNAYIDFKPKEFVEFIIKNSNLTKYELIVKEVLGDNKERPIYRLFN